MRAMPHRLAFIDETSTSTKLTRLRGRSMKGERLPGAAPFGHWHTQTFIAALRCHGLTAPDQVEVVGQHELRIAEFGTEQTAPFRRENTT